MGSPAVALALITTLSLPAQVLTVPHAPNDSTGVGGQLFFDLTVGPGAGVTLHRIDVHLADPEHTAGTLRVWTTAVTSSGSESSVDAWTPGPVGWLSASAPGLATYCCLPGGLYLPVGTTGVCLEFEACSAECTIGTGSNQQHGNAALSLRAGSATAAAFADPVRNPRVFNGSLHYFPGAGPAPCPAGGSLLLNDGQSLLAEGETHPQMPAGATVVPGGLDLPVIDQNGESLFRARFNGGGVTAADDRAWFRSSSSGGTQIWMRAQDQAPGLQPGILLGTATSSAIGAAPRISPTGGFALLGSAIHGPGVVSANDSVLLWSDPFTSLALVREGDAVPGLPGGVFTSSFGDPAYAATAINSAGMVCFRAVFAGPGITTQNDEAWFLGTPGNIQLLLRQGDGFPFVNNTGVVVSLDQQAQLNDVGQTLVRVGLGGTFIAPQDDEMLVVVNPNGTSAKVVREFDLAQGTLGARFTSPGFVWLFEPGAVAFTSSAKTAFVAGLFGGDATPGINDQAIYYGGVGTLSLVVRRGQTAPTAGAAVFDAFAGAALTCGNDDTVAFFATLAGSTVSTANDGSLWARQAGTLKLVAREGNPAPGFPPGSRFAANGITPGLSTPRLNNVSQLLFGATVTDAVGNARHAQYAWTATSGLELVLASGDVLFTPAGPFTASNAVAVVANSAGGAAASLNDSGEYVMRVTGSGAVMRGRLDFLRCAPSTISATAGGTQILQIDAGAAYGNGLYIILCSASGTQPGFPFGGKNIPLNPDDVFQQSLDLVNSSIWSNTLSLLDPSGRATATFNLPPGLTGVAGLSLAHAAAVFSFSLNADAVSKPCGVVLQ